MTFENLTSLFTARMLRVVELVVQEYRGLAGTLGLGPAGEKPVSEQAGAMAVGAR